MSPVPSLYGALGALLLTALPAHAAVAQLPDASVPRAREAPAATPLEALVDEALTTSPMIHAARSRVDAARAAVGSAGALPDPMLGIGVMNLPLSDAEGDMTAMTATTIGIGQTVPFPGKRALERRIAEAELRAADAHLEAERWEVEEAVRAAYYELAFLDRALEIVQRNEKLLGNFAKVTEARYGVGTGSQADVLKARVESSRLAEEATGVIEMRNAALARLNAVLSRPTETPVDAAAVPDVLIRAAVPASGGAIRFASATLGARAVDSPLPPLAEIQEVAVRTSPVLRAHEAMIAAQAARVELAGLSHLPDFDLFLQYGQRSGRSDVVSAMVSVPIPLQKGRKQDLAAKEAEARLAALRAEHHQKANELRARVAERYAEIERERTQLALFLGSIIPQGRAALESATASFQVGRVDFMTLLENQATLYSYENAYYRSLTTFADRLAKLERTVGKEILR